VSATTAPRVVATLCAVAALAFGTLATAYRGTLVRQLRDRHPAVWREAGAPGQLPSPITWWRLGRFLRAERYYQLNDADLVTAARNYHFTSRAMYAFVVLAVLAWLWVRRS
jgi:hypothetical protein